MSECKQSVYLAEKSIDMIDAVNRGYEQGRADEQLQSIEEPSYKGWI